MTSESHKTSTHSSADHGGSRPNKQLDKEIRDMVSAITNRVTDIHKSGSIHHEDEDEHGVRIITLAGTNTGATLRSELDQENMNKSGGLHGGGPAFGDADGLSTYVNSNFQAVNNSLMMGGSYTTNDPGVHLDITDVVEPHGGHHGRPERRGLKGKKGKEKEKEKEKEKQKETFHSDQHDEQDED